MARDRLLNMDLWVIHMYQERGVNLGNQHLEWNWGKNWEKK